MANDPKKLSEILTSGALGELGREAERRRSTTAEIRRLLPTAEADHLVSAARNEAGELVVVMDSPSWAARARYCTAVLAAAGKVIVKVAPRGSSS